MNLEYKVFVLYVATLGVDLGDEVHLSRRALIPHLKTDEVPTKVSSKYTDFIDVFSPNLVINLSEYTRINDHIIKLTDD